MNLPPSSAFLRCGSLAGMALAAAMGSVVGEELDLRSLSNARVSEKYDQRLGEQLRGRRLTPSQEGVGISVFASLAYDDNIFRESEDEKEDLVAVVAPEIRYTKGQEQGRAWVSLAYRPTAVIYFEESDESRIDQYLSASASVRHKVLRLAYDGSWARLGYPDPDVGGNPERDEWDQRVTVGWDRGGKTAVEAFADWRLEDQDQSDLNDVETISGGLSLIYRHSPKTELGLTYQVGEVDVDNSPTQDFQRITGGIDWRPRPNITAAVEAGAEYRDFGPGGDDWEPVFAGRIQWTPCEGLDLYLTGYRREEASAFFNGQNFTVLGFAGGLRQRLHGGWSLGLEGGWEESDYFSTTGGGADRDDTAVFIRPSVMYDLSNGMRLQFYYQWSDNDSSDPDFDYENNESGVNILYIF